MISVRCLSTVFTLTSSHTAISFIGLTFSNELQYFAMPRGKFFDHEGHASMANDMPFLRATEIGLSAAESRRPTLHGFLDKPRRQA